MASEHCRMYCSVFIKSVVVFFLPKLCTELSRTMKIYNQGESPGLYKTDFSISCNQGI